MAKKSKLLSDQLREAIAASDRSMRSIALDSGVTPTSVSRFMKKERSLTFEAAEKIAEHLGLELKPKK